MTAILIPYGVATTGRIVHVDDVPNGKRCQARCPSCAVALIAKNNGVRYAHHFAHEAGRPACEGWLHATAKLLLHQRSNDALNGQQPLMIQWACTTEDCGIHAKDLLGRGILTAALVEHRLPDHNIRPDIVCMAGDVPKVLIEVVDTHAPEPPVYATGLPVLEFHVSDPADLEQLSAETIQVSAMRNYPCPDPKCPTCRQPASIGLLSVLQVPRAYRPGQARIPLLPALPNLWRRPSALHVLPPADLDPLQHLLLLLHGEAPGPGTVSPARTDQRHPPALHLLPCRNGHHQAITGKLPPV